MAATMMVGRICERQARWSGAQVHLVAQELQRAVTSVTQHGRWPNGSHLRRAPSRWQQFRAAPNRLEGRAGAQSLGLQHAA